MELCRTWKLIQDGDPWRAFAKLNLFGSSASNFDNPSLDTSRPKRLEVF
jgi:hypothetical protein